MVFNDASFVVARAIGDLRNGFPVYITNGSTKTTIISAQTVHKDVLDILDKESSFLCITKYKAKESHDMKRNYFLNLADFTEKCSEIEESGNFLCGVAELDPSCISCNLQGNFLEISVHDIKKFRLK